jgi:hypothetical protein
MPRDLSQFRRLSLTVAFSSREMPRSLPLLPQSLNLPLDLPVVHSAGDISEDCLGLVLIHLASVCCLMHITSSPFLLVLQRFLSHIYEVEVYRRKVRY